MIALMHDLAVVRVRATVSSSSGSTSLNFSMVAECANSSTSKPSSTSSPA